MATTMIVTESNGVTLSLEYPQNECYFRNAINELSIEYYNKAEITWDEEEKELLTCQGERLKTLAKKIPKIINGRENVKVKITTSLTLHSIGSGDEHIIEVDLVKNTESWSAGKKEVSYPSEVQKIICTYSKMEFSTDEEKEWQKYIITQLEKLRKEINGHVNYRNQVRVKIFIGTNEESIGHKDWKYILLVSLFTNKQDYKISWEKRPPEEIALPILSAIGNKIESIVIGLKNFIVTTVIKAVEGPAKLAIAAF